MHTAYTALRLNDFGEATTWLPMIAGNASIGKFGAQMAQ